MKATEKQWRTISNFTKYKVSSEGDVRSWKPIRNRELNVTPATIRNVYLRRTWKHV